MSTARLVLEVNGKKAERELKSFESALGKAEKQGTKTASSLSKFGKQFAGGLGIATAGIATLGVGLAAAAKVAIDFEKSMSEVSTLLDDTSGMDQLTASVRELSKEYGGNVTTNAQALYSIISSGASDAAEATAILDQANKLAIGGVTDVATAADGLTSALNAYSQEAYSAEEVSDAMFVGMKAGRTTIAELSTNLGNIAPIASQVGISFDELTASVAAYTTAGVTTSKATNDIKAAITNIIKPAKTATDLAEELGLEFNATALAAKGLKGFLDSVAEATKGDTEQMSKLFGSTEALGAVMSLTGGQADAFADTLGKMGEKAGETEKAMAKMKETFSYQWDKLKAQLTDIGIALGTAIVPALNAVVSAALEAISVLVRVKDAVAALFDTVDEKAEKTRANLSQIGIGAKDAYEGLASAIGQAAKNLGVLEANMSGIPSLSEQMKLDAAKKNLESAQKALKDYHTLATKAGEETAEFGTASEETAKDVGTLATEITVASTAIASANSEMETLAASLNERYKPAFDKYAEAVFDAQDALDAGAISVDVYQQYVADLNEEMEAATETTGDLQKATEETQGTFEDLGTEIGATFEGLEDSATSALAGVLKGTSSFKDAFLGFFKSLAASIVDILASSIAEGIIKGIAGSAIGNAVSGAISSIGGGAVVSTIKAAGAKIAGYLGLGVAAAAPKALSEAISYGIAEAPAGAQLIIETKVAGEAIGTQVGTAAAESTATSYGTKVAAGMKAAAPYLGAAAVIAAGYFGEKHRAAIRAEMRHLEDDLYGDAVRAGMVSQAQEVGHHVGGVLADAMTAEYNENGQQAYLRIKEDIAGLYAGLAEQLAGYGISVDLVISKHGELFYSLSGDVARLNEALAGMDQAALLASATLEGLYNQYHEIGVRGVQEARDMAQSHYDDMLRWSQENAAGIAAAYMEANPQITASFEEVYRAFEDGFLTAAEAASLGIEGFRGRATAQLDVVGDAATSVANHMQDRTRGAFGTMGNAARKWGDLSKAEADALAKRFGAKAKEMYEAMDSEAQRSMQSIAASLKDIPDEDVYVDIFERYHPSERGSQKATGTHGQFEAVPSGYPNDSYPVWMQTGEDYMVRTPQDRARGDTSGSSTKEPELLQQIVEILISTDVGNYKRAKMIASAAASSGLPVVNEMVRSKDFALVPG